MKSINSLTIGLFVVTALLVGCNGDARQANSNQKNVVSSSHPKLYKPKTFLAATQRLKQLHESLMADGDFPDPVKIEYVEVLHGQGASAHSHFYSAASYQANKNGHGHDDHSDGHDDHSDGHSESDERVKHHSVEVGLRAELADIIIWLPKIAAKSNLSEADWNSVDSISSQLTKVIEEIGADASDASFRESWKLKSDEIRTALDKVQAINESVGAAK